MLFRKYIEPRCEYCRHGTNIGEDEIVCYKFGITSTGESCPKFRYSPEKREPERRIKVDSGKFKTEDFEL